MAKHIMQIPHCIPFCLLVLDLVSGCCCARLSAQDCRLSRWLTAARCVSVCATVCVFVCVAVAVGCCCLPAAWHCQSLEKKRNHLATFGCNSFSH